MMTKKIKEMKDLIQQLDRANKAYYQDAKPIMSDREYDKIYDELLKLEKETGLILSNSPSQHVGYSISSEWNKVKHEFPALSLDKTKDRSELVDWIGSKEAVLSWKEDGLTVVATYDNGELKSLVTRGSGEEGEDITVNARYIHGIPMKIPYDGHLVVRGEAMISYESFNKINENIPFDEDKYATPRNLASGTIRNYDQKIVHKRNPEVIMFELVYINDKDLNVEYSKSLDLLSTLGFDVVEHILVNKNNLLSEISNFENRIKENKYPSDGLVLAFNDIAYGKSLGTTGKFPRHSIAFKWNDDTYETKLIDVEWSTSKNSINPVAIFETVNIDGADISRASIHNVSIMEDLKLGKGDIIEVYLSNKIIPQIAENKTKSNTIEIPSVCPVCGSPTEIKQENNSKVLICTNQNCQAKLLGKLELACSKEGFDIDGLSTAQLQVFINKGWLKDISDIYNLYEHKTEMTSLPGFGLKSVNKLLVAIEKSKEIDLAHFIRGLGIPLVGKTQAKLIAEYCHNDIGAFEDLIVWPDDLINIYGIGNKIIDSFDCWFCNRDNHDMSKKLINIMHFKEVEKKESKANLEGQIFVITGSLKHFSNRNELKEAIENAGGKVSGSISSKTTALINNNINSTSGKNKKAKELGIKIITEEEIMEKLGLWKKV